MLWLPAKLTHKRLDDYTNNLIKLGKEPQIKAEANFGRMPEQDLGEVAGL